MNTVWARLPAPTIVHRHRMSLSERYEAMDEDLPPVDGGAATIGDGDGTTPNPDSPLRREHDGDRQRGGIIGRQFPALRKRPDRGYRGAGGSPNRVVGTGGDDGGNPPLHQKGRRSDDPPGKKKHQQFLRRITNLQPNRAAAPPRPCPSNDTEDTAAMTADGGGGGASRATESDGPYRPAPRPAPGPGGGLARMASSRTLGSRRGDGGGGLPGPGPDAITATAAPDRRAGGRQKKNGGGNNGKKNPPVPNTWYYSSNHILINEERARRNLRTLCRSSDLDDEARIVAGAMAERGRVLRSDMNYLAHKIRAKRGDAGGGGDGGGGGGAVAVVLGENVGSGRSIREVHAKFLKSPRDRSNMLDGRFREMGIGAVRRGAATGERDGGAGGGGDDASAEVLFVCQLFKG